jgi:hypothetical protein
MGSTGELMKNWGVDILFLLALVLGARCLQATEHAPKYDKAKEAQITGVVVAVKDYTCPISGTLGAHITVQPEHGRAIEVHLAATKYVKTYEMVFAKGDKVEVLGSKLKLDGSEAIMVREITRGQDTFTFRDANGKPLW